jgi:hypothetical protein
MDKCFSIKSKATWIEITIVIAVIIFVFWALFYGRKPYGVDGIGFDGKTYAQMAREFYLYITHSAAQGEYQSAYYVHRIFTSAMVWFLSRTCNLNISNNANLIQLFCVVNFASIIAAMLVYYKIAKHYHFNNIVRLFGFSVFFIKLALLKISIIDVRDF